MNDFYDSAVTTCDFYSKQNRYIKDYYKVLFDDISGYEWNSIVDIGCASGDFLYYLSKGYNSINKQYVGIDIIEDSIQRAKSDMITNQYTWICGDYLKNDINIDADIVTMLGVLYLFDDFKAPLDRIERLFMKKGGIAYIFGSFNSHGIVVEHRYRNVEDGSRGSIWEHSISEISQWLDKRMLKHEWIPFNIQTEVKKTNNPYRAWTIELANGSLELINGLNVVRDQYFLKIVY